MVDGGQCKPLCDGTTMCDKSSGTVVAGSCERNGRNAAELLGVESSIDDMDGTLARLDSGKARSNDDADTFIGRGFGRADCEEDTSTIDD